MRGLAIEIDPGLPAVLVPGLLQQLDLVCRSNAEAIQGKDGRPHRDAPRALNHGFVTARAQHRGAHRLEVARFPNLIQHLVGKGLLGRLSARFGEGAVNGILTSRIGLAARDLDLDIGVTPHLMEELALTGGLIGGPVVGAAVVVLHNLIKKPFEESTRIKYTVKGDWAEPIVSRLAAPAAISDDPP